ncbi:MAG: MarR family transcriptional regulator [Dehalococcoidia bacterium]
MSAENPSQHEELSAEEEYETWGLLIQTRDAMIRLRDREVKPLGITSMQGGVLWVLKSLEAAGIKPTPAEIARWLFRQPPSISALLNRMEKLGLIECQSNPEGKRQVAVKITPQGNEAYRSFIRKRGAIPRVITVLSAEEREQLRNSLAKLRKKAREELVSLPIQPEK